MKLGCHVTKMGSFHAISIHKKRKETKRKVLTILAQAETLRRCSVFINFMKTEE